MSWTCRAAADLDSETISEWKAILQSTPELESPFFQPQYTMAVSRVLDRIEVGIFEQNGKIEAIFPFERGRRGEAIVVGRRLADYQGVICRADFELDARAMLRQLGLRRWQFDHLAPIHKGLEDWCWTQWESPQIACENGYDAYLAELFSRHKSMKKKMNRSVRRLEAQHGEVDLQLLGSCPELLDILLGWKCEQYESTQRDHPFRDDWVRQLLAEMLELEGDGFSGRIAVLTAGDVATAMEYVLVSGTTAHSLISAFDADMAPFAPGSLCNLRIIQACEQNQITKLDMGKGIEAYKQKIMNEACTLGEGAIDLVRSRAVLNRSLQRTRHRFLRSRWSTPARQLARSVASVFPPLRRYLAMR